MQVHGNFVHVHSIMLCRVSSDILRPIIVLPMTLRSIDELGIRQGCVPAVMIEVPILREALGDPVAAGCHEPRAIACLLIDTTVKYNIVF